MTSSTGTVFPLYASGYEVLEQVGDCVDGTVHRARCIPLDEIVAIKILDPEKCTNRPVTIQKEVHDLSLLHHPNLVTAHCSFLDGNNVWIVMPYMSSGSCLTILKSAYTKGLEESVVATLLREILTALAYLHGQEHIHRDVKAGNILADSNGTIKLGDFGVTFAGSPRWMAPETMQHDAYDFKADIWSFGITALELAHGHVLFAKTPPMTVLLRTLQNIPCPDCEQGKKFSKAFRELVAACLVKDPNNRPTAAELLEHRFFQQTFPRENLSRILCGLNPLSQGYRKLKEEENEEKSSQHIYMHGLSVWESEMEDLLKQIALIPEDRSMAEVPDLDYEVPKEIPFESPGYKEGSVKSAEIYPDEQKNDEVLTSAQPPSPVDIVAQIMPFLQNLLVQNIKQRETLLGLAKLYVPTAENRIPIVNTEGAQIRETDLLSAVQHLQQSVKKLEEEVKEQKRRNAELEEQINSLIKSCEEN